VEAVMNVFWSLLDQHATFLVIY